MTDFYTPIYDEDYRQARKEQLNREYRDYIWETADKCVIPMSEMRTSHLIHGFNRIVRVKFSTELEKEEFDHWYYVIRECIKEATKRDITLAIPTSIEEKHSYLHAYDYLEGLSQWDVMW